MKIYSVEFIAYTNVSRNTVSNGKDIGQNPYLNINSNYGSFLVKECVKQYGNGFKNMTLVGELFENPDVNKGE